MNFPGAQVLLLRSWNGRRWRRSRLAIRGGFILVEKQGVEMRRNGDQGLDGGDMDIPISDVGSGGRFLVIGGWFEGIDVAEFDDNGACFDEFVEEVVVRGRVG